MANKEIDYTNTFKVLPEIPIMSVTDIKEAPMRGFKEAKDQGTGVYITNRGDTVGVMLTKDQYEGLVHEVKTLRNKADYMLDDTN